MKSEDIGLDKSNLLGIVDAFPEMVKEALRICECLKSLNKPNCIIISGMGGSAIAGDLAADFLRNKQKAPIIVNRNYLIPSFADKNTLFIASSYSGDTEETLSALKDAERAGAEIICITSGGKLNEIAAKNKYLKIDLRGGLQPRFALPSFFISLLKVFEKLGFIEGINSQIDETNEVLAKIKNACRADVPLRTNPAKQLAKQLQNKIPVIFCSSGTTEAMGRRLKGQLNENAKANAILSVMPEMNHNELEALDKLKRCENNFAAIFIRDEEDHIRVNKRIEIVKSMLGAKLGGAHEIPTQGKSRLARMFSQLIFIDYFTVYLALLNGVDPADIQTITKFKKEMLR
ncbi:MAG: glucose/mannose-6-phosphate isomerase [Candidatus Saganbacteria bacterium]|uniref:Glucose/mannose-6-phosphate isomerase n=1 Tax=Candidatus Saganbacteria bacterium TaxID=2575572 RepID=A0A833L2L4_UNCSA|nr:MAG: glucose/mannose-6-phosphate isomerase [Candidatus Saganbacteria bacterium]